MQLLRDVAQQARYQAMLPAVIAARSQDRAHAVPTTEQPAPAELPPSLQDADRAMLAIMMGVAS